MVIFFAALGLPGLCGFIGEVLVVLSVWRFSIVLAVISAAVVILTAGYILWTIQRVYLGPEYKGPHAEALRPMTLREIAIAAPLVVMAVVLGVFPKTLLEYTDATIKGFVERLNPARQTAGHRPQVPPRSNPRVPAISRWSATALPRSERTAKWTEGQGRSRPSGSVTCGAATPGAAHGAMAIIPPGCKQRHYSFRHDPRCQGVAVNLHELIQYVLKDLGPSLHAVWPELSLCAAIVLLLLARMIFPHAEGVRPALLHHVPGRLAALWFLCLDVLSWPQLSPGQQYPLPPAPQPIFTGLLVLDSFGIVMRSLLMFFLVLFVTFTRVSGVPNDDDATEFYVMILGATIGLCIMVTANHVLMVFLGIEMASVPCYVLAGILRHRRASSEAALKYVVFGGAAAGVMLYGFSLLCGVLGSAHLPTMAHRLADWLGQAGDRPSPGDRRGARVGRADDDGRPGLQALGRAVPLLGPGRFRRRAGRSGHVPFHRLEGRRRGPLDPAGADLFRMPGAAPRQPHRPSRPWPRCGSTWPR